MTKGGRTVVFLMFRGGTCAEPCFRMGSIDVCGDIPLPARSEFLRSMIVSGRGA